jgi:hypothetical protein
MGSSSEAFVKHLLNKDLVRFMESLALSLLITMSFSYALPEYAPKNEFFFIVHAIFWGCAIWLLLAFIKWAMKIKKKISEIKNTIKELIPNEKKFLKQYFDKKTDSIQTLTYIKHIITLLHKGVIVEAQGSRNGTLAIYMINQEYKKYIKIKDII